MIKSSILLDWIGMYYFHVANLYEKLGYKEKAAESIQGLLILAPSNIEVQKLAIDFYARNGYYFEALRNAG